MCANPVGRDRGWRLSHYGKRAGFFLHFTSHYRLPQSTSHACIQPVTYSSQRQTTAYSLRRHNRPHIRVLQTASDLFGDQRLLVAASPEGRPRKQTSNLRISEAPLSQPADRDSKLRSDRQLLRSHSSSLDRARKTPDLMTAANLMIVSL